MTLITGRRGPRGAYTLMEMLIVIIVMMTLVAITLPIAKKTMDDAAPREASRQLLAMFSLARAKAANTGRPWGVWMDCEKPLGLTANGTLPVVTDAVRQVTKLYLAEVPPLYSGEFTDSRAAVPPSALLLNNGSGPWPIAWSGGGQPATTYGNHAAVASLFTLITGLPYGSTVFPKTEFFIRFNAEGPFFRGYVAPDVVNSPAGPYVFYLYGKAGADLAWGKPGIDDNNNGTVDDIGEYLAAGSDDIRPPFPLTSLIGVPPTQFCNSTFQVVRQPQRVGNVLELSGGSCIDLAYSGMGNYGVDFSGYPKGYDVSNISALSYHNSIVVMFLPGGGVDSVYLNPSPPQPAPPLELSALFGQQPVAGTLQFLIGKVNKLNFPVGTISDTDPKYLLNMFDPKQSNLADPGALWLSIGRYNGAITTSENIPPALLSSGGSQLTYQFTAPSATLPTTVNIDATSSIYHNGTNYGRPKFIEMCRTIASGQQQIGGQ